MKQYIVDAFTNNPRSSIRDNSIDYDGMLIGTDDGQELLESLIEMLK